MSAECGVRSADAEEPTRALVCFAVRDEARHFHLAPGALCKVLVTGMGARQARDAFQQWLETRHPSRPRMVLTCGYAGGLHDGLRLGQVIFDADPETDLQEKLTRLGARPARFHCAPTIAVTAASKQRLRTQTGADAVEMESGVIRRLCQERGIPAATVRVISDEAGTDLPLDFNQVARPDGNISYARLAGKLIRSPGTVCRLMRFRRDLNVAARSLGEVLTALMRERCG